MSSTPSPTSYAEIAGRRLVRLETLADGIFAIAMTLLVLDIKVPTGPELLSDADHWQALVASAPRFISYLLGFLTLGIFWVGHATQLDAIERSDRNLAWLTIFFLFWVSLVPFTTAFLSQHFTFVSAVVIYWANIAMLGISLFLHWTYARHHGMLRDDPLVETLHRLIVRRIGYAQLMYGAAMLVAFVNTGVSVTLTVTLQLFYAIGLPNLARLLPKRKGQKPKA